MNKHQRKLAKEFVKEFLAKQKGSEFYPFVYTNNQNLVFGYGRNEKAITAGLSSRQILEEL